jgi:(2S)-methylsuccinyl-CoA dehydrogenase
MPQAALRPDANSSLLTLARVATGAVEALLADAAAKVRERVVLEGRPAARLLDREQRATHGLAWLATYVEAVRQLTAYAERMQAGGLLTEVEELIVRIGLGEYLAQIQGGIPISQGEIVRPADLGLSTAAVSARMTAEVEQLISTGNTAQNRARLVELICSSHGATVGACGLDETLESIREEMRRVGIAPTVTSPSISFRRWRSSAYSGSPSPRSLAGWASARNRCA